MIINDENGIEPIWFAPVAGLASLKSFLTLSFESEDRHKADGRSAFLDEKDVSAFPNYLMNIS